MTNNEKKLIIAVMGLGYVGINIAYEFSKKTKVIGFDINKKVIKDYKNGIDKTNEIGNKRISNSNIIFTYDAKIIKEANVIIVTVPTPVDEKNNPNLSALYNAATIISNNMQEKTLIIFESTVSPGTTDEIIKYIEKKSLKKEGEDFFIGYSPERINPGDNNNKIYNSVKIISANQQKTINKIFDVYNLILDEKNIYSVNKIIIAEAAKIIENTQRDVNIAFMNEISRYLYDKSIPTKPVFDAMSTKWNALNFTPGLVGGHCIGIDPYYLINSTNNNNQLSIIKKARKENEAYGKYLAKRIRTLLTKEKKIGILGFTYKPNVNDIRNTKVFNLAKELEKYGYNVEISDCLADTKQMYKEYGIKNIKTLKNKDLIILAVPHQYYLKNLDKISKMYTNGTKKILFDLYNIIDSEDNKDLIIERI